MAGGLVKYRHLSRSSAHRQALLRNLVTSLVKNESIHTTWHKAKEAQRLAEKLITYAKRDNEETRRKAQGILYTPHLLMPKLFGTLKTRYADRPGGYTRILRTEPKKDDQAQSAVLELVDGPYDMRFAMTAATVARDRELGREHSVLTQKNIAKVTRFRKHGEDVFEAMVERTRRLQLAEAGPQLADMEPVVSARTKLADERLKRAKPLQNYWKPNGSGSRTQGSAKSLSAAIGEPATKPAEKTA
ncbi:54S ribosomal protein L8, mitochondrial [Sporothrix eucalyptigena]|uniref:54S ribosomal protein L8, mitochondrial n=1 Tax=Sporothrix eucalyptigena TaxID=1812306 RepID=A0ABP0ARX9_9PEZI